MVHAAHVLSRFEGGCVLAFNQNYTPKVADIISFSLIGLDEDRIVVVAEVVDDGTCVVSHMKGHFTTLVRLVRIDRHSFRVVFEPHHHGMPEAF